MAKLTARQEAFVREYLLDGNAAAAMRRTGYAGKSPKQAGWWHMQSKAVREAVDEGRKRLAEEAGRRALDVLHDIQDVSREAREGGDLRTALRGLELEGKHYGMFTDRVRQEISGPGGGPVPTEIVVSFVEPGGQGAGESGEREDGERAAMLGAGEAEGPGGADSREDAAKDGDAAREARREKVREGW